MYKATVASASEACSLAHRSPSRTYLFSGPETTELFAKLSALIAFYCYWKSSQDLFRLGKLLASRWLVRCFLGTNTSRNLFLCCVKFNIPTITLRQFKIFPVNWTHGLILLIQIRFYPPSLKKLKMYTRMLFIECKWRSRWSLGNSNGNLPIIIPKCTGL